MDTDGDDNHHGDLNEIGDDERALSHGGRPEGHVRADHQANNAAHVLNRQAEGAGDGEDNRHASLVSRRAVGDKTGDGWGDDVADKVTHSGAGNGAQGAAAAGKDGKADEAESYEE